MAWKIVEDTPVESRKRGMMRLKQSKLWLLTALIATVLVLALNTTLVDTTFAGSPSASEPVRVFQIDYATEYWGYDPERGHKLTSELTEDTGSVLIFIHGGLTDSESKAPEAQSLATECGLKAFLSFEYRDRLWEGWGHFNPYSDALVDCPALTCQARDLLLLTAEVYYRTGAPPVLVAHSRGASVLIRAATLWEGLAAVADIEDTTRCEEEWAKIPGFIRIWRQLDEVDRLTLLNIKKAIRDARVIAVTACPFAARDDPGWESLQRWAEDQAWNLYSTRDWLVWLVNPDRGYIPSLRDHNVRFRFEHGNFCSNMLVRKVVADLLKDGELSEETWEMLIEHNFGEVPELDRDDLKKKLRLRPEPPPWDDGNGGGGGGASLIMPVAIDSSLGLDQADNHFLEKVSIEVYSTPEYAVDLIISNNNPFSITFLPVIGSSFSPQSGDLQGLMVAPGGPVILAIDGVEPGQGQGYLFTVPAMDTVEVTLNAVCLNRFKPLPSEGYTGFTVDSRGKNTLLTPEQNEMLLSIMDTISVIEFRATNSKFQKNEPFYTAWLSIVSHEEVLPDAIQFAVWTVTDNLSYHYLKYDYWVGSLTSQAEEHTPEDQWAVNTQLIADQVNLILTQAGVTESGYSFAPSWDVNWDFVVDNSDHDFVEAHLGEGMPTSYPNPDVNRDSKVDLSDLDLIESHLGEEYKPQVLPPLNALNILWGALYASPLDYILYLYSWSSTIWVKATWAVSAVIMLGIATVALVRRRKRRW